MPIKTNALKKRAMLEALEKSLGVVNVAARAAGVDRTVHYDWLKKDAAYKQAVDDIQNIALDFAESKLHKQIERGDTTATIFYLKTKGKARGYIERQEVTADLSGKQNITVRIVRGNITKT